MNQAENGDFKETIVPEDLVKIEKDHCMKTDAGLLVHYRPLYTNKSG